MKALAATPVIPGSPAVVPGDRRLPLRSADLQAALAGLYRQALRGAPTADLERALCRQLARLLRLPLAVLARRLETGAVAIDATSRENGLWLELQRIPERWDSGVSSRGPAAAAQRAGAAIRMSVDDEGFSLWRASALAEQVRQVLAIPLSGDAAVLELYFDGDIPLGASAGTLTVDGLAAELASFFDDLRTLAERSLLANALASAGNGAFITDLEGNIVWSNAAFSALSGYAADEVRGRSPGILRSGQQGVRYYRDLWGTIRAGRVWSGETVDRGKDGSLYTIRQVVSPVSDDGQVTHYLSLHHDIGREKRARTRLELASRLSPTTGLLTPAAFDTLAGQAIQEKSASVRTLVVVSLRGLQRAAAELEPDMEDFVATVLGKRLRETVPEPRLAGMLGPFEYVLLVDVAPDERLRETLTALAERLAEPIPYLGDTLALDVHFGTASFPRDGMTLRSLWHKADRQLADEPYRRAHRTRPN